MLCCYATARHDTNRRSQQKPLNALPQHCAVPHDGIYSAKISIVVKERRNRYKYYLLVDLFALFGVLAVL